MHQLALSQNGHTLVSKGAIGPIRIWDVSRDDIVPAHGNIKVLWRHERDDHLSDLGGSLVFSPDGTFLVSGGCLNSGLPCEAGKTLFFAAENGELKKTIQGVSPRWLQFNQDGSLLVTGDDLGGKWIFWGLQDNEILHNIQSVYAFDHEKAETFLGIRPDLGIRARCKGSDCDRGVVELVDVKDHSIRAKLEKHSYSIGKGIFSPDGMTFVSVHNDGVVVSWDLKVNPPVGRVFSSRFKSNVGEATWPGHVAYSPDGKILALIAGERITFFDTKSGETIGEPFAPGTQHFVFSPDGAMLASNAPIGSGPTGYPYAVLLWDVGTRHLLVPPLYTDGPWPEHLAFSPDGRKVAASGNVGNIKVWEVKADSLQTRGCRLVNRNLTRSEWNIYVGDEPYKKVCPELPGPDEKD